MKKLIIRTPNHLGDCIIALPAVRSLAHSLQDCQIYLLAPLWSAPIFEDIPQSELILLNSEHLHGWRGILHQSKMLRHNLFDDGIIMPPSFSSALAFTLGKVRNRYGLSGNGRSMLLNHTVYHPQGEVFHRAALYQLLVNRYAGKEISTIPSRILSAPQASLKLCASSPVYPRAVSWSPSLRKRSLNQDDGE